MSEFFKALHAIQLTSVDTKELVMRVNGDVTDAVGLYKHPVNIVSAHNDFDEESKCISVGLRLSMGMEEGTESPVSMQVEVVGNFIVDLDNFNQEHINIWADKNAPAILYPFIREHAFALSVRCGLPPAILPLIQVPTLEKGEKVEGEE